MLKNHLEEKSPKLRNFNLCKSSETEEGVWEAEEIRASRKAQSQLAFGASVSHLGAQWECRVGCWETCSCCLDI